jgi:hypothetical protein
MITTCCFRSKEIFSQINVSLVLFEFNVQIKIFKSCFSKKIYSDRIYALILSFLKRERDFAIVLDL